MSASTTNTIWKLIAIFAIVLATAAVTATRIANPAIVAAVGIGLILYVVMFGEFNIPSRYEGVMPDPIEWKVVNTNTQVTQRNVPPGLWCMIAYEHGYKLSSIDVDGNIVATNNLGEPVGVLAAYGQNWIIGNEIQIALASKRALQFQHNTVA